MPDRRRIVRGAAVGLGLMAIASFMYVSHRVSIAPPPAGFGAVLLAVTPLIAVLIAVGWRTHRLLAILSVAAAIALLWLGADSIGRHLPLVYLLQNVSADAAMMSMFGISLVRGHEPLVSRFARMVRGSLSPPIADYTRKVTAAWALFFASMIVVSLSLYAFAPISVWSVFANLLAFPLVCVMFIVEYTIRRRVLRDVPHSPITTSVRAWWAAGRASSTDLSAPRPPL